MRDPERPERTRFRIEDKQQTIKPGEWDAAYRIQIVMANLQLHSRGGSADEALLSGGFS